MTAREKLWGCTNGHSVEMSEEDALRDIDMLLAEMVSILAESYKAAHWINQSLIKEPEVLIKARALGYGEQK